MVRATSKVENLAIETFDPIRTKSDKAALKEGYRFDRRLADAPVRFIERFCRISSGEGAGKPFRFDPWQKILVWSVYGWVDSKGLRRFREAYVSIAKKNGKTTLVSALLLYHLLADGESDPEIHLNAVDKDQASRLFKEAMKMVRASPALKKRLKVLEGALRIVLKKGNGEIRTNSADVPSKDGANASLIVFDELHLQKSWAMWSVFRYAGIGRSQPLKLSITTAGVNRNGPCWDRHTHAWDVLDGNAIDVRFFALIFGPRPNVPIDVDDRANWHAANPTLGRLLSLREFESDLADAKRVPSEFLDFRRYRLNEWVGEGGKFFDMQAWGELPRRASLDDCIAAGWPCWAGLDLSSTSDLTSLAVVFHDDEDDVLHVFTWNWAPRGEAERRSQKAGIPYMRWSDAGRIELTKGKRIDYRRIEDVVVEVWEQTRFRVLNMDSYNAQLVGGNLLTRGVPVQKIGQGWKTLSEPTKEFERRTIEGGIAHGHDEDPVLAWCLGNAVASSQVDRGNVTVSKGKSAEKIDALDATLNAVVGWFDERIQPDLEPLVGAVG